MSRYSAQVRGHESRAEHRRQTGGVGREEIWDPIPS